MIRSATKNDVAGVLNVYSAAFRVEKGSKKWRDLMVQVENAPQTWRVLSRNGQIVGALHIDESWLRIGRSKIFRGDVGQVCVLPKYHGMGYGTKLMKDAVQWMWAEKFDISQLGGLVDFYSKFGYRRFLRRYIEFTIGAKARAGASLIDEGKISISDELKDRIRPYDAKTHFSSYVRLYNKFNKLYTGVVVPGARQSELPVESPLFLVVEGKQGEIHGFMCATEFGKDISQFEAPITITEIGFRKEEPDVFRALIAFINNYAIAKGIGRITARIPFDPELLEILASVPVRFQAIETYGGKSANMLQIINLGSLFERLIPELQGRLQERKENTWKGTVEICIEKAKVRLAIEKGEIHVMKNRKGDVTLALKESYLLKLIFGLLSFGELKETASIKMQWSPEVLTLLTSLFPRKLVASNHWC